MEKNIYGWMQLEILNRPQSSLETVWNVYFFENIIDVGSDGIGADVKTGGDFLILRSGSD